MTDEVPGDLIELSETYLDLFGGSDVDEVEVEEDLEYWQEQVNEFEEGTPMYEMAVGERDKLKERFEELSTQEERHEQFRTELLTRSSTEFAPQNDWLHESVISALSLALTGKKSEKILIGDHSLPDDADTLSKKEMVAIAKNIHAVSKHAIDSSDIIEELWEKMSTNERAPITEILAQEGSLISSGDISDQLDKDATDNPGANLRYVLNSSEYYPYYREAGAWTLSLVGEYVWQKYGDVSEEENDENAESGESDKQASLDSLKNSTGGASNE
ncbi:hypothetical protein ACFQDG_01905 [Natronoarchaeum mannanilyticum]|uniref:Uncharacterized protein n=1 Tax=Natronoarchaeum mannanilyticum TaxID=926360 RepID=A0AAV3TBW1_9EURY